jgi:hypothetical protein
MIWSERVGMLVSFVFILQTEEKCNICPTRNFLCEISHSETENFLSVLTHDRKKRKEIV